MGVQTSAGQEVQTGQVIDAAEGREALAVLLGHATLELGRAGKPGKASRLAARGLAIVRHGETPSARRLNGVLHSLARMPEKPDPNDNPDKENRMAITPLDVRAEPPARRHSLIFDTFGTLAVGDGFELINDHDPKPLYYQLEAEQTGKFSWEYKEQGPEAWRVEICRTAE
ncbi:MAG: DUF2249 domain-containing protein [Solirubrobacterales bacterium]|nr:DUF2249 domain-containing protein [Solirubrobacterales bacterium]